MSDHNQDNNNETSRHYKAFISYRHKPLDLEIAKKLHRRIERYVIPKELRKTTPASTAQESQSDPSKLGLVFRDQDELPISDNLTNNIRIALDNSEFLIVICSKDTPESLWVQREITYFLEHHSRNHLLAILISGSPEESFPKQLTEIRDADGNLIETIEPLAANIVAKSDRERNRLFETESLRILASLIGCPYDALYHREERYKKRRSAIAATVVAAVAAVFIGMLINRNAKIREQLLASMINESKALAELSNSAFREGNYRQSLEYALDALPGRNPDRPYVAEAEAALSDKLYLYDAGIVMRYTQSFERNSELVSVKISSTGTRSATCDYYGNVNVYDTNTGQLLWTDRFEKGLTDLYYVGDLLLAHNASNSNAVYSPEGEQLWTSTFENVLDVSETGKSVLSFDNLTIGYPACVKDVQTGSVIRDLGTFDASYFYPAIGALSPDANLAAMLVEHSEGEGADLFLYDLTTGESRILEKNILFKDIFMNFHLRFDERDNLVLACSGNDLLLTDYDDSNWDYLKYYSKEDDWALKFTAPLDFGTDSWDTAEGFDLAGYIDFIEAADGGIILAGNNNLFMVSSEDGSTKWHKDLPSRVRAARYYPGKNIMALILQDGTITFCGTDNGSLTRDTGVAYMDCHYSVSEGEISDLTENRIQFLVIPSDYTNRTAVVTFCSSTEKETPSWAELVSSEPRILLTSPSGTYCASVYVDSEDHFRFIRFDPSGQTEPVELTGTCIPYYKSSSDHADMMLTDTGKLILYGRVFDFESGTDSALSRSGQYFDDFNGRICASCQNSDPATITTACVEQNEDKTYDLVLWEDGKFTGQASRIPLRYEDGSLVNSFLYCDCQAVSPNGYAVVWAQNASDGASQYLLYNIEKDEWSQMPYMDAAASGVFTLADSHPWMALIKSDGSLCLIDLSTGEEIRTMDSAGSLEDIQKILFTSGDQRLLTFALNGMLEIFDTADGSKLSDSLFSSNGVRFSDAARYEVYEIPETNRLLMIYDNTAFTEAVGIALDLDSMKVTGLYSSTTAYFPALGKVLLKPYTEPPCLSNLYSVEEMEEIAEEILQSR